jgi:hypothetical protein
MPQVLLLLLLPLFQALSIIFKRKMGRREINRRSGGKKDRKVEIEIKRNRDRKK